MNLTDAQKQTVAAWIEQGLKLSEIQNRLTTEFGLRMTYIEVRFLIDDLKLRPKDQEPAKPTPTLATGAPSTAGAKPAQPVAGLEEEESAFPGPEAPAQEAALGNLQLSVDQVTRAGALVSGKVTFSDGQAAEWYLDQFGRLGLSAKTPGYRPSQADVMAFQTQLQAVLANSGF